MNKLLLIFLIIPTIGFCQIEKSKSKIEELSSKSGSIIKKEFEKIATFNGAYNMKLSIEVLKITDLKTNIILSGVKIAGSEASIFLDKDEIDGLITALNKMKEVSSTPVPTNYTEYVFISKTGFKAGLNSTDNGKWSFTLDMDKYGNKGFIFFEKEKDVEAIDKLNDAIAKAKALL